MAAHHPKCKPRCNEHTPAKPRHTPLTLYRLLCPLFLLPPRSGELPLPDQAELLEQAPGKAELFFTEGPNELALARAQIAAYSLPRAARRLAAAKAEREADPMGFGDDQAAEVRRLQGRETGGRRLLALALCAFTVSLRGCPSLSPSSPRRTRRRSRAAS